MKDCKDQCLYKAFTETEILKELESMLKLENIEFLDFVPLP